MNTKLARPQWQTLVTNPKFGMGQSLTVLGPDQKPLYETFVRCETPGEINIVIRKEDGAIAFVKKERAQLLPKIDDVIVWRNAGHLDILTAPSLGMELLEITRGWVFSPNNPWKIMTEGQEETGLVVENVQVLPHVYANSAIDASWIDMSFGFATDKPYGKSVDEIEKVEIKKVVWLLPQEVRRYQLEGNCALSKAAIATFRAFCLENSDQYLKELGSQL